MKSISIHGLDEGIKKKIEERAKSEGRSVNKIVKEWIADALGQGERPSDRRAVFADLCGVWTEAEAAEFAAATAELNAMDPGDWR
jgi:plasmid stability protein